MMYDELVERLRAGEYTLEELSIILSKAADAIEELSRRETSLDEALLCIADEYYCLACGWRIR